MTMQLTFTPEICAELNEKRYNYPNPIVRDRSKAGKEVVKMFVGQSGNRPTSQTKNKVKKLYAFEAAFTRD
jgi:hypothetical protein